MEYNLLPHVLPNLQKIQIESEKPFKENNGKITVARREAISIFLKKN